MRALRGPKKRNLRHMSEVGASAGARRTQVFILKHARNQRKVGGIKRGGELFDETVLRWFKLSHGYSVLRLNPPSLQEFV